MIQGRWGTGKSLWARAGEMWLRRLIKTARRKRGHRSSLSRRQHVILVGRGIKIMYRDIIIDTDLSEYRGKAYMSSQLSIPYLPFVNVAPIWSLLHLFPIYTISALLWNYLVKTKIRLAWNIERKRKKGSK